MSLIITATDLSDTGNNAVHYACRLAMAQHADVAVIHSFVFPVMFSDVPLPAALIDDTQADADKRMDDFLGELRQAYPQLHLTGQVAYGNIVDILNEHSENNVAPWMIVVGNSNTTEVESWFDSALKDASTSVQYPLLAVPPNAIYGPVKKLCFATDNQPKGSDMALTQICDLTLQLDATLDVLYAEPDGMNRDNLKDIDEATKNILMRANPQYHIEYGVDVDMAIVAFAQKNETDWLVLMPRRHGFLSGLFHKSHTKTIAHKSHIPILLLHENNG